MLQSANEREGTRDSTYLFFKWRRLYSECSYMGAWVWGRRFMCSMLTHFCTWKLQSTTEWPQVKLSKSEPSALHLHWNIFVHGAKLEVVKEKTRRMWMLCSVGIGLSASPVVCYSSVLSVLLCPDVDPAYANVLGKGIVFFPWKDACDLKFWVWFHIPVPGNTSILIFWLNSFEWRWKEGKVIVRSEMLTVSITPPLALHSFTVILHWSPICLSSRKDFGDWRIKIQTSIYCCLPQNFLWWEMSGFVCCCSDANQGRKGGAVRQFQENLSDPSSPFKTSEVKTPFGSSHGNIIT